MYDSNIETRLGWALIVSAGWLTQNIYLWVQRRRKRAQEGRREKERAELAGELHAAALRRANDQTQAPAILQVLKEGR